MENIELKINEILKNNYNQNILIEKLECLNKSIFMDFSNKIINGKVDYTDYNTLFKYEKAIKKLNKKPSIKVELYLTLIESKSLIKLLKSQYNLIFYRNSNYLQIENALSNPLAQRIVKEVYNNSLINIDKLLINTYIDVDIIDFLIKILVEANIIFNINNETYDTTPIFNDYVEKNKNRISIVNNKIISFKY